MGARRCRRSMRRIITGTTTPCGLIRTIYNARVVTDPKNMDRIFVMSVELRQSLDGGKTLQKVNEKNHHGDNHAMWIDPDDTRHWLLGSDGGMYETWDDARNWADGLGGVVLLTHAVLPDQPQVSKVRLQGVPHRRTAIHRWISPARDDRQHTRGGAARHGTRNDPRARNGGVRGTLRIPLRGAPDRQCQPFGARGTAVLVHRKQLSGRPRVRQLGGSESTGAPMCDRVNATYKKYIRAVPRELFAVERLHLKPLPAWIPEVYRLHQRTVDVEGYVSVNAIRYSVPV